jgi:hypothetical protein
MQRKRTLDQTPIVAIWLQLDIDNVDKSPLSPRSTCPNRRRIPATKAYARSPWPSTSEDEGNLNPDGKTRRIWRDIYAERQQWKGREKQAVPRIWMSSSKT